MKEIKICVIGLGYVGLPLARLFSTKYKTVGYDMNKERVDALMAGHDSTLEVSDELLQSAIKNGLFCTADIEQIRDCNFYVVAVPTPVDRDNRPDLTPLYGASTTVGKVISKGDIVVYESTVYPGVTEDECIPVVEKVSGMRYNVDFFAGYSPERINPGDKLHTVEKIKKVTSGSTPEIGELVNEVYSSVIVAGTHLAPSIKVAEAAKVIENSQRDINIAFVNELSKIFNKLGIDTQDVLEAASTKWNFLPFCRRPLHRRRSLLPCPVRPKARLQPRDHPCRPPHERRNGRVRRHRDSKADAQERPAGSRFEHPHPRFHIQGELPGRSQHQGHRHLQGPEGV